MNYNDRSEEATTLCKIASYAALGFFVFFLIPGFLILGSALTYTDYTPALFYIILALCQLAVFFLCRFTIKSLEEGNLIKARKRSLISGIMGLLFNLISGIFTLIAYSKIKNVSDSYVKKMVYIKYCPNCGAQLEESYNFCPKCGLNLREHLGRKETKTLSTYVPPTPITKPMPRPQIKEQAVITQPIRAGGRESKRGGTLVFLGILGFVMLITSIMSTWMTINLKLIKINYTPYDLLKFIVKSTERKSSNIGELFNLLQKLPSDFQDLAIIFGVHMIFLLLALIFGFISIFVTSRGMRLATSSFQFISFGALLVFANRLSSLSTIPLLGYRVINYNFDVGIILLFISLIFYTLGGVLSH